jgi:hypothetical protein
MKDIACTGDNLTFENGDLKLVDGDKRVMQQVVIGLKILKGDWFLDYRKGIDYFNGLKAYPQILKAEIKKAILEVQGVDKVLDYAFNRKGEQYEVNANVVINNQSYNLSEVYTL